MKIIAGEKVLAPVLFDFNHSILECQVHSFPEPSLWTTKPYCPDSPLMLFTKAHDVYSMGLSLGQILGILFSDCATVSEMTSLLGLETRNKQVLDSVTKYLEDFSQKNYGNFNAIIQEIIIIISEMIRNPSSFLDRLANFTSPLDLSIINLEAMFLNKVPNTCLPKKESCSTWEPAVII